MSAPCKWLGQPISSSTWAQDPDTTLSLIGRDIATAFPWLRYRELMEQKSDDERLSVWWITVFHEIQRFRHASGDVGVAFATAAQTGWRDCIVFEDCVATRQAMARALELLQILYRDDKTMHFAFGLDDMTMLPPFILDEFLDMSTVTAFPENPHKRTHRKKKKKKKKKPDKAAARKRPPVQTAAPCQQPPSKRPRKAPPRKAPPRKAPPRAPGKLPSMKRLYYWMLDQEYASIVFHYQIPVQGAKKSRQKAFVPLALAPFDDTASMPAGVARRGRLSETEPTGANKWLKYRPAGRPSAAPQGFMHWVCEPDIQTRTGVHATLGISNVQHNTPVTWVEPCGTPRTALLKQLRQDCADALEDSLYASSSDEDADADAAGAAKWSAPPPARVPGVRVAQTFAAVQAATAAASAPPEMDPGLRLCVSILGSAEAVVAAAMRGMDEHQRQLMEQAQSLGGGGALATPAGTFADEDNVLPALLEALENGGEGE